MTLDFERIAEIFDTSPQLLEKKYRTWLHQKRSNAPDVDLKLLASLSGLSVASLSNFINNKGGTLSKTKQDKLEKLFAIVNYAPSNAAKKLRSIQKKSVAFISPLTNSPNPIFYTQILRGVKKEAQKYGFYVDIYDISEKEESRFFSDMPFLGMVDGLIIVSGRFRKDYSETLLKKKLPVVLVHPWEKITIPPVVEIVDPDTNILYNLLVHLFSFHRYRNPAFVSLTPENHSIRSKKVSLFKKSIDSFNIKVNSDENIFIIDSHTFREGKRILKSILKTIPNVDVIICMSDIVAASVIYELKKMGRKIAVTGYDNSDIAELFSITTVDQKMEETGRISFERLYYAIQYINLNDSFPSFNRTIINLEFIKRDSCKCDVSLRRS